MKLISHESPFTLPPGTYYLGDPCYVLSEDDYKELMQLRWGVSRITPPPAKLIEGLHKAAKSIPEMADLVRQWDEFAAANGASYPDEPLLIDFGKRGSMLTWQTAHGDGRYKVRAWLNLREEHGWKIPGEGLAVDSGQLAFVDVRLMRKGFKRSRKNLSDYSGTVELAKPLKVRIEGGDMKARGLRVKTS